MLDLTLQELVYGKSSRMDLMEYKSKSEYKIKIGIYRNHSFELIEHTIAPYLDYAGIKAEFVYSDYDDSLSFVDLDTTTDMMILWLDLGRYTTKDLNLFLKNRVSYLSEVYKKPVLIAFLGKETEKYSETEFPIDEISKKMGDKFFDYRMEPFSGTRISMAASLELSKQLGLNYIPSIIGLRIKAIIVDLDNTLYKGVLGEDGISGLQLTDSYKEFQEELLRLKNEGFFLCIASKNELKDVEEMLEQRQDFLLKKKDFSNIFCSWKPKYEAVNEIINTLNIGTDSLLFIDDNPGELLEMESAFPEIKKLLVNKDAVNSSYMLRNYPGIKRLLVTYEDIIRNEDMEANKKRKEFKNSMSNDEYLKTLHMKLTFSIDCKDDVKRISELANKTNQFIFNYKRYTMDQLNSMMEDDSYVVVSIRLSDCLSDSGIIATCIGKIEDNALNVEECFISCRALGRGIEKLIVGKSIEIIIQELLKTDVSISFIKGEKNIPAEKFLMNNFECYINKKEKWNCNLNEDIVEIEIRR